MQHTYYSQKDLKWASERLGTCPNETIGKSGCKISCLASFCGKTPSEVNKIIPYVSGCLTEDVSAAKALGLPFLGKTTVKPDFDCIAETDHFKSRGVLQHFFILLSDGRCIDPLDAIPVPKKNPYKIVSYRLFKPLLVEEPMEKEFVKALSELTGEDYGSNLNEKEQKYAAKKLNKAKEAIETLQKNNKDDLAEIVRVKTENEELRRTLKTLDSENNSIEKELEKLEREVLTLRDNLRIQTEKAAEGIAVYGAIEILALAVKKMLGLQR